MHDHCLCSVGDSCDRCSTVHPVAFTTKAEVDSLLQRVLDLEVRLKTENKSLCLQVLALEERNDHLESKIAMLRSKTNDKAKPPNTNNKGRVKGAPSKITLLLPAKSLPHSSTTVSPTHIGNPLPILRLLNVLYPNPSPHQSPSILSGVLNGDAHLKCCLRVSPPCYPKKTPRV